MAFIVEQKIKGRIYLYNVESYWDKEKKQSRQKRTYIGPKEKVKTPKPIPKMTNLISKAFGDVFLLKKLSEDLGIKKLLKENFPDNYEIILALAMYNVSRNEPHYLYPHWHEEHYIPEIKKIHSSSISALCKQLGEYEKQRISFMSQWAKTLSLNAGVCYDITSISSYSTCIDYIEWGYNRDGEDLPQINMGVVFCQDSRLPFFYTIYPGSIVDVTTLNNCLKYLKSFGVKDIILILDRGFCSKFNISEMNKNDIGITFIQPLTFTLKKLKY